jgi:cell division septal protein FtsQ
MGKKKRKKSSGGGFAALGRLVPQSLRLFLRSMPILLVILAGGAVFMGIRSALYADYNLVVQKVTVEPAPALSVAQRERLDSQVLGKNILNTDLHAIAQSLEKDPSIQNVKARRRLPSEIIIEVQKRTPLAFIQFANTQTYGVISEDGMVLDVVEPRAATGLIIEARQLGIQRPSIGQHLKHRGFQEAVQFLHAYYKTPLSGREPVTRVLLDSLGNVSVILKEGPEVRLGRRPSQRVEAFKKIVPLLEGEMRKKIAYIDLQYDDVVVKQRGGR